MTESAGQGPESTPAAHEHSLRLVAVHLEDSFTTREFACETCGVVWFS